MDYGVMLSCNIIDRINDKSYEFKMFSKKDCPYCSKLEKFLKNNKNTLKSKEYEHYLAKYEIVGDSDNVNTFFDNLSKGNKKGLIKNFKDEHKTFPVLFRGNEFIGGCDESIKLFGEMKIKD